MSWSPNCHESCVYKHRMCYSVHTVDVGQRDLLFRDTDSSNVRFTVAVPVFVTDIFVSFVFQFHHPVGDQLAQHGRL